MYHPHVPFCRHSVWVQSPSFLDMPCLALVKPQQEAALIDHLVQHFKVPPKVSPCSDHNLAVSSRLLSVSLVMTDPTVRLRLAFHTR